MRVQPTPSQARWRTIRECHGRLYAGCNALDVTAVCSLLSWPSAAAGAGVDGRDGRGARATSENTTFPAWTWSLGRRPLPSPLAARQGSATPYRAAKGTGLPGRL